MTHQVINAKTGAVLRWGTEGLCRSYIAERTRNWKGFPKTVKLVRVA